MQYRHRPAYRQYDVLASYFGDVRGARGQAKRRMTPAGAYRKTSPSGFHGHGGTALPATSRSIARTIARTPFSVPLINGVLCSDRSLISDSM